MQKPLLNINNPKPITAGGAYWLQGFEPETVGNRNQLRQNFWVYYVMNSATHANWANLPIVQDFVLKKEAGLDYIYFIGGRYISRHYGLSLGLETTGAIVNTINDDGDINSCYFPGMTETEQGNILYTSEQNLGRAFYGFHKTGTTTTTIIDKAGRDLSALNGLVVRNIRDASTATITSVTTTTETNDTLNFSGGWSDSGNIAADEEWVVFVDTYKDLNTATYPHFGGQIAYSEWGRPILNFDGDYFIGHGNYIAKLSNDETTFDEDYSQLPSFMQLSCMEQIGNNILIGGEKKGKGLLLLWDGVTPNKYQSIIPLTAPIYAIKEYRGGAIIYSGCTLYWTDGYSIKRLNSLPGTNGINYSQIGHSGMAIDGKNVFLNAGSGTFDSRKRGVWVYDIERDSWIFNPYELSASVRKTYGTSSGGVFLVPFAGSSNQILASYSADRNTIAQVVRSGSNSFSMAIFAYTAPRNTKINFAELVLGQVMSQLTAEKPVAKITMALSDGKKPFWMYGQVKTGATATNYNEIPVDGSNAIFNKAVVGDLIMMLEGVSAGQYAFITEITNKDTATEVWTLDRNFTAKVTNSESFSIFHCSKMGEHNISDYLEQPLVFPNGLTVNGDFYVFIIIENTSGSLDLRDISLF
jgi:hypothetical protein